MKKLLAALFVFLPSLALAQPSIYQPPTPVQKLIKTPGAPGSEGVGIATDEYLRPRVVAIGDSAAGSINPDKVQTYSVDMTTTASEQALDCSGKGTVGLQLTSSAATGQVSVYLSLDGVTYTSSGMTMITPGSSAPTVVNGFPAGTFAIYTSSLGGARYAKVKVSSTGTGTGTGFLVCRDGANQWPFLSFVYPGTASNQLGKGEDLASATGDTLVGVAGVRVDAFTTAPQNAAGDYGYLATDNWDRVITVPEAPHALIQGSCSTAATTTANTQIAPNQGAGVRTYVTSIGCSNQSAVASEIQIKDGTTAVWYGGVGTQATTGGDWQKEFSPPLKGSQNTALQFAMTTTATNTICCARYYVATD